MMIRAASRSTVRKVPTTRGISCSSILKQAETPIVKPNTSPSKPPGNKKKFSFTKFLFQTTVFAATVYGATLYAATKNDKVLDFVIDQQLPYHEELLDLIEKGSFEDLKKKFTSLQSRASEQLPSKDQFEQLTSKLEHQGEHLLEETKKKFSSNEESKPKITPKKEEGTDTTPAQQLQKPVEIEAVQKSVEHLPLIKIHNSSVDASVKSTIESFNDLIKSIETGSGGQKSESLIKAINENVSVLALKLNSLTKSFDDELQSKLKVSQTELLSSYTKKELELTENFLHQFNQEKTKLETKLNQRLKQEIDAAKETISQAAVNAVTMVRIDQTKKFEKLVQDKIDQERNGRLANLESLISRLNDLEKFSTSLESQLKSNHQKALVQQSINQLKKLLSEESSTPKLLTPYIQNLAQVSQQSNDELLTLVLKDLVPLLAKESNQSILTNSQLLARWEQLSPELRSASLLPPNAGLLGHLSSLFFSKLLLPVKGSKPNGKDIESVIGRVEQSLTRGELDVAVEEAANLKGWSRELARDWVLEGRKRLEAEFLLSLIDSESKIL